MSYSETISNLIENLFENSKRASSRLLFKRERSSKDIKELVSDIIDSGNNIVRVQSAKEFFFHQQVKIMQAQLKNLDMQYPLMKLCH